VEKQDLRPHPILQKFISNYTFLDDNNFFRSVTLHGTASGNTQLFFFFTPIEAHFIRIHDGETYSKVYNTIITGQFTGPTIINTNSWVHGFIIDFTPVGIMNLFDISGIELNETFYEVEDVLGDTFKNIHEQVEEQKTNYDKKKLLDNFFLTKFNKLYSTFNCTRLNPAVQHIIHKNGCIDISELRNEIGISKRYFEKQFKELVGVKPTTLRKIVRANCAINLLQQNFNYFDIIESLNYYDQAHFIKELKWLTGITPKKLTNKNLVTLGNSYGFLEQKK
jgi:AraC-like DNA-binding protein